MNKNLRSNESGMALVFAIGLLALLLMIGMAFIGNAVNYRRSAENNSGRTQARMFALSAVSRAITSLTLFSQDFAVKNEGKSFPESFDTIYSFAKYKNSDSLSVDASSGEKITDALLTKDSLLTFPLDGSLISEKEAERFNQLFSDGNWPGSWVFFTNGKDGDDKRIIGRAAWQVIGLPADIRASAFLRGYLPMDEYNLPTVEDASAYIPNENRWGREIDEVYLNTAADSPFYGIPTAPNTNPENVKYDTYDALYSALNASDDYKKKRWIDRWFLYGTGSMWEPEPYSLEAYSDGYYTLARFNISELSNGVDWKEEYTGDDQWYARFKLASTDFNSENAIKLLTKDSLSNLDKFHVENEDGSNKYEYDYELLNENLFNGLPFLRRIGSDSATFKNSEGNADLASFRKQIAANFNDYCDADSTPSSNVSADKWLEMNYDSTNDIWNIEHPDFTGNEKTPYIYEVGMNMGILPAPADWENPTNVAPFITAKKQSSGEFKIDPIMIKAAPILKLCNIYPFDPAETVNGNRIFNPFTSSGSDDFMRGYVDFGDMVVNMRLRKVILKNVKFSYDVEVPNADPALPPTPLKGEWSCDVVLTIPLPLASGISVPDDRLTLFDQKDPNPPVGDPDKTIAEIVFKGKKWRNSNGVELDTSITPSKTNVKPIIFSEADVDNSSWAKPEPKPEPKPYPVKKTSTDSDPQWQMLEYGQLTSSDAPYLQIPALGIGISDLFYDTGATDNSKYAYRDGVKLYNTGYTPVAPGTEISDAQLQDLKTALLVDSTKVQIDCSNLNDITIESVWIEKISTTIRRMVLTANKGTQEDPLEIGVDYVRGLALTDSNVNPAYNASDPDSDYNAFAVKQDVVLFKNGGNYQGIILGAFRNYDPRQNLNAADWRLFKPASSASYVAANYLAPSNSEVSAVMNISSGGDGEKNSGSGSEPISFSPKYSSSDNEQDWETANEPAFLGTDAEKHISTAVIRNAPMMSPWEIGFIHRGAAWQTINIKKAGYTNFNSHESADSWNEGVAGSSYANGDGAILQQIKMTDRIRSYGKINVNRLRKNAAGFTDYEAGNKAIIQALFAGLQYGEKPADFINNTTRDATTGKFLDLVGSPAEISMAGANDIVTTFLDDSARKEVSGRHKFIDYATSGGLNLACAFSSTIQSTQKTDAAKEELIGKTINLLSADSLSPTVVKILVVAQSIRDAEGTQVRNAGDAKDKYNLDGIAGDTDKTDIDDVDLIAVKECKLGRFDMTAHKTDHGKNIYFDEISGEVRLFVELHHDTDTGKITIKNIRYL